MPRIKLIYKTCRRPTLARIRTILSRIRVASSEIYTTGSSKTPIFKDSAMTDIISCSRLRAILAKARQYCSIELLIS
jgi:hypothetical protein